MPVVWVWHRLLCIYRGWHSSHRLRRQFSRTFRSQLANSGVQVLGEAIPPETPDCVIRSSAVPEGSEVVRPWLDRKIPVFRRGEFISRFTAGKKVVAVVGSHGKTTTAGMLVWALSEIGLEVSYMIGGLFEDDVLPAGKFVKDSWLIMEVDESDGTIDGYSPEGTLALNCDWDHVDRYAGPNAFPDTVRSLFTRSADALIVPKGSNLENWAMEIAKSKVRSFKVPEDPADFLLFNTNAAIAAGEYLGENLSSVDFQNFRELKEGKVFFTEDQIVRFWKIMLIIPLRSDLFSAKEGS